MEIEDLLLFGVSGVISSLALAAMHWTPIGGSANVRDRRICYALGTCVTVGVPLVTMVLSTLLGNERGQMYWASLLLVNTLISGAAVQICYLIDDGRPVTRGDV